MRLSKFEQQSIKNIIKIFDTDADIYLFGSRVDDCKKGGDIDLLVYSKILSQTDAAKIRHELWEAIGE